VILVLSVGLLLYFLDDVIYRIFEGNNWPEILTRIFKNRLNKRIENKTKEARDSNDTIKRRRLWTWLRRFPLKEKRQKVQMEAVLPTRMGNILWAYENYPKSRYGIRAIFYWPRLWLTLDSNTRKDLDTIWAEADCLTYISFVLYLCSILNLLAGIFDYSNIPTKLLGPIGKPVGWEQAAAYLRDGQRKCYQCSRYFPASLGKCPKCAPSG